MQLLRILAASAALLAAGAAVPGLSPSAHAVELKIAVVDFQEALNQVKEGDTARARLEGMFSQKKAALQAQEQALMKKQQEYQNQSMILTDAARKAKEQELMQAQMTFQQSYMQSEQEMQMAYAEAMEGLISKMRKISEEIAAERGYDLVVEKTEGGVVFAKPAHDITAELIKRYNARHAG